MNITEKIQTINNRVIQLKENFKTALQNKNVTVSDLLKLKDYPNLINEIKGSVAENIDLTNLTPENIRAGVTINGVSGTLVEQWDVVISPTEPKNPRNGMIWIRDMSDESNNESGDDSGGGDSSGNDTGDESSLTSVEVYASYLENPVAGLYFNGTYTIQDSTKSGKEAVYINETNYTELYWQGSYWCMKPIVGGYPYIIMYNRTGNDPWEVVGTDTNWRDDEQMQNFPAGTVTLVGSGSEGGTSNADYIVSGATTADINGDYVNTGNAINGRPSYSNGKGYYILYTPNFGSMWQITSDITASGAPKYSVSSNAELPPTSSWSGGITVTEGGGNSGGNTNTGYIVTYFENYPNLEGNYLKANTPSWGDSSYEYYKHQDIDVYLYIAGSNAVFRSFDAYGFTSDYWFSSNIGNNIVGNLIFMNENLGNMWNVTVTQG